MSDVQNLVSGESTGVRSGDYMVVFDVPDGSAELQVELGSLGFQAVENATKTADANGILTFGECNIKAVLTGNAQISLTRIRN